MITDILKIQALNILRNFNKESFQDTDILRPT